MKGGGLTLFGKTMGEARLPFVPPVYVRCVMDCLNSLGIQPSAVLSNAGLNWQDLCDGQHMVDFDVFRRFIVYAIRCSGEQNLGLIVGSMLQPYHTPVGIGAVTSESLGEGISFLSRHAKLVFGNMEFQLEHKARASILSVKPILPLCETHVFVAQTILGAYCRLLEAILGRPSDELSVGLPYPRPHGNDIACLSYVRRVNFDREFLALELPSELLGMPSIAADAKVHAETASLCQKLESELLQGAFVHRVRRVLLERLATNPDVGALALELGISVKILTRRLAEVGTTYSEIKDELRKTHASWFLQNTELSIESIASQLGYADPTNFTRKFKDWYRVAPSKLRQSMRIDSQ
jgi:AraC-like DNA-binding protein